MYLKLVHQGAYVTHRDTFRNFCHLLNIAFLGNKDCNISQGDKICYKIVKRVFSGNRDGIRRRASDAWIVCASVVSHTSSRAVHKSA